jgi:hypothetical protein
MKVNHILVAAQAGGDHCTHLTGSLQFEGEIVTSEELKDGLLWVER